ncbi:hypothetical protein EU538_08540 [Candidatus Thorarchaeota archaeon]|nr:MAG: hypothetical protein EU538_08540 [Candidatus Thorarchaeota archaeon]
MKPGTTTLVALTVALLIMSHICITTNQPPTLRSGLKDSLPASYVDHAPIVINDNQGFVDQGWPGSGTEEDPYVISGLNITSNDICIFIHGTSVYFIIRDCVISSAGTSLGYGIHVVGAQHGSIQNCIVSHHAVGSSIMGCTDCALRNNTVSQCERGVDLQGAEDCTVTGNTLTENDVLGVVIFESFDCTITNNTASESERGFHLTGSDRILLTDNKAIHNNRNGFQITGIPRHGSVVTSDDCILSNNTAIANGDTGFLSEYTRNCTLVENMAWQNGYGIQLSDDARTNLVYLNALFNNTINGFDNGTLNRWDNGTHGNYWGDYDGTGPYDVPGPAQSADENPFVYGLVPPRIDQPPDIEYNVGSTGHSIQWHPSASHPDSYDLFVNGTLIESGEWVDNNFTVDIDGWDVGVYNCTLVVRDITGNTARDTVMVVVKPSALPDNPFLHPVALFLTLLGVSIAAVFGVLLVRHRVGRHIT